MSERERSRSPAKQRSPSPAPASKAEETSDSVFGLNIHVNNLARSVTDEMLRDLFGKYGKILEATVVVDPHTKESRGFGFVRIESIPDGEAAIEALNGTQLEGRDLGVQRAKRDRPRTPTPGQYQGRRPGFARPYPRDPRYERSGGYERGGYDRYADRGYDRYADRGYDRGYDRAAYYDPRDMYDRGYDRAYDRGYERERGYDRYDERAYPRGYERDYRPPYDRYEGRVAGYDRAPPRGYDPRADPKYRSAGPPAPRYR
eukprot:Colp12_sorted_trinity150504_noHs@27228